MPRQQTEQRQRSHTATLTRLRAGVEQVQGRRMDAAVLPVAEPLGALLPGGGLRSGAAYSLSPAMSLLFALLAEATRGGSWVALVGMPDVGVEAAQRLGVDLTRVVLIPHPGPRWLAVAATVADALPLVAVRPQGRVSDAEATRLQARLRDRGAVLLSQGHWPGAEAQVTLRSPDWRGIGQGHGYLDTREVTVEVASKRRSGVRRARVALSGAPDGLTRVAHTADSGLLQAVG